MVLRVYLLRYCWQFGTNGIQHHQHNIREDLTSDGIELEDEEDEYDEEENENEDQDEEDEFEANQTSSETNSPQRKRAKRANSYALPIEYMNLTPTTPITLEQFDELPIHARSKSLWNKLLLANPKIWKSKCQIWHRQLHEAFEARDDVFIFLVPLWNLTQNS